MVASWPLERFGEMTGLARQLERENAALRAQLAERDAELDRLRRSIVAAIDGKPCPTPAQWTQMQAIIRAAYPKE